MDLSAREKSNIISDQNGYLSFLSARWNAYWSSRSLFNESTIWLIWRRLFRHHVAINLDIKLYRALCVLQFYPWEDLYCCIGWYVRSVSMHCCSLNVSLSIFEFSIYDSIFWVFERYSSKWKSQFKGPAIFNSGYPGGANMGGVRKNFWRFLMGREKCLLQFHGARNKSYSLNV